MTKKFEVGDLVVYPTKGVGKIVGITRVGEGEFYVIELLEKGIQIKVPVSRATKMGVRTPISAGKAKKVLSMIKNYKSNGVKSNWNKRQKLYREKLMTGRIEDTVEVFAELLHSSHRKQLSFGERKLMDQVKNILFQELAISSGNEVEEIEKEFNKILS